MSQIVPPAREDEVAPQETRRREILDAAAAVFGEKGFQRATMKDIAARAGIVPGTIYLYFQNKRDLLIAIADQLIFRPVGQTFLELDDLSAEEFLTALVRERMQFARDNGGFLKALVPEIWTDAELQERFFTQIVGPVLAGGAAYLEDKIGAGRLRECRMDIVVSAIAGSIIMLSAFRAMIPTHLLAGVSDEEIVAELTCLYLHGLAPDHEEPAE